MEGAGERQERKGIKSKAAMLVWLRSESDWAKAGIHCRLKIKERKLTGLVGHNYTWTNGKDGSTGASLKGFIFTGPMRALDVLSRQLVRRAISANKYGSIFLLTYVSLNQEASKTHLGLAVIMDLDAWLANWYEDFLSRLQAIEQSRLTHIFTRKACPHSSGLQLNILHKNSWGAVSISAML